MRKIGIVVAVLAGVALSGPAWAADLAEVIAGDQRSTEQKARDEYRHPMETLQFFGLEPDMTVVEIYPFGGWYTAIIAPYLEDEGEYYAALYPEDPENAYRTRAREAYMRDFVEKPELYGDIRVTELSPEDDAALVPAGTADMVLTFRNMHNMMRAGTAEGAFRAFYDALKPGGILGVVQHRADDGGTQDPTASTGYVQQSHIVKLATDAGFRLVGQSEVNANPHDTKDYPEGVWTLPPTYSQGDQDRDIYAAIGESDRMTLKFVKPGGDDAPDDRALKLKESLDDLQSGAN